MKLTPEERLAFEEAVMRKRLSMERKPITPASRPDVARAHWPATKDRIRAGWKRVESGPVLSLRVWASQQPPQGDFAVSLDLIADHIEALEARQVKLEMFARMARERGQLENAIAYLDGNDKAFAEFDGDGDG